MVRLAKIVGLVSRSLDCAKHTSPCPQRHHNFTAAKVNIARNKEVRIFRYVTEGSFDAYMWQTLETKARFIQQVMRGETSVRSAEDLESGALTYAEIKAIASGNPAVVEKSLNAMRTSLRNAKLWGSYSVLLVPAVVNPQTSYRDAWTRSQTQIRKLIPLAQELRVVIAVEEVWNKFLLSPLEFAKYIDEFNSPWVKAWFDVGNVVLYGYPQDWIRTLGKRIVELHLKDFKRLEDGYRWVNLGEGDIDWPEVRKALAEIGYSGTATTELEGGDEGYLRDVSKRVDRLALGSSS